MVPVQVPNKITPEVCAGKSPLVEGHFGSSNFGRCGKHMSEYSS